MTAYTSSIDTFARDNLPAIEQQPEFVFDLPELKYPDKLNCAVELIDRAVARGVGNKLAIISETERWTYHDLLNKSNQIANVLRDELGLIPGNRVLLRSPNSPMLFACWLAVVKAGGVVVTTMPLLRSKELHSIVDKAQVALALCDHRIQDELNSVLNNSLFLKSVVCFGCSELEGLMADKSTDFDNVQTALDDVVLLGFTSGTTGEPKATIQFHRDVLAIADTFSKHIMQPEPHEIYCGTPPIAFTFGLGASLIFPLRAQATIVTLEKPSPDNLLHAIVEHKITTLFTAPTAYRAILSKLATKATLSLPLQKCVSAGEALPKSTSDMWYETTGIRLIDGIGATEMMHIFISASGKDIRPGSTGKAVPGYQACVVDEDNNPLPLGSVGLLAVKGPTGCRYLADTRQSTYVANGWNLTGDIYRVDKEGYFWYQGRSDDMIISSGYNIAAIEVEGAILGHDSVLECAVVGEADEERGNLIKAFIILKAGTPGNDDLVKNIQTHVKQTIAPYKYPRAIEFVDSLPKTATGKLQRFRLR